MQLQLAGRTPGGARYVDPGHFARRALHSLAAWSRVRANPAAMRSDAAAHAENSAYELPSVNDLEVAAAAAAAQMEALQGGPGDSSDDSSEEDSSSGEDSSDDGSEDSSREGEGGQEVGAPAPHTPHGRNARWVPCKHTGSVSPRLAIPLRLARPLPHMHVRSHPPLHVRAQAADGAQAMAVDGVVGAAAPLAAAQPVTAAGVAAAAVAAAIAAATAAAAPQTEADRSPLQSSESMEDSSEELTRWVGSCCPGARACAVGAPPEPRRGDPTACWAPRTPEHSLQRHLCRGGCSGSCQCACPPTPSLLRCSPPCPPWSPPPLGCARPVAAPQMTRSRWTQTVSGT